MPITFTYEINDDIIEAYNLNPRSNMSIEDYCKFTLDGRLEEFINLRNESLKKEVFDTISTLTGDDLQTVLYVVKTTVEYQVAAAVKLEEEKLVGEVGLVK